MNPVEIASPTGYVISQPKSKDKGIKGVLANPTKAALIAEIQNFSAYNVA